MILGHARDLNLTDEQKAFMRAEVQKATTTFQELQWKLQDQAELLHETMKSTSVNEQQALAQLDRVLEIEREIKRLHIGLAVRLKNRLTPEQQEQLHKMRMDHHHAGGCDDRRLSRTGGHGGPPLQLLLMERHVGSCVIDYNCRGGPPWPPVSYCRAPFARAASFSFGFLIQSFAETNETLS